MRLTGITIKIDGHIRFVGKVGLTPPNRILPQLARVPVLYREVPYKDLYSYTTQSIGVDAAAWEKAVELGAEAMLCYCKDERAFFYVPASMLAQSKVIDLGEFPQYRVPLRKAQCVNSPTGLSFGWTNHTVQAECVRSAPEVITYKAMQTVRDAQLDLFGFLEAA